jgi:hypothetical protein
MKKLILSTAIAGLFITNNAIAQTTVTGELRLAYKSTSVKGDSTESKRGIGNEQQLNIQTKGRLNVGNVDYAAGFSIENDGSQATTLFNENTYMDFTLPASGTTFSVSRDHIQRSDTDRSNGIFMGYSPSDTAEGITSTTSLFTSNGTAVGQAFGLALIQNVNKFGKVSFLYVPTAADTATASESVTEGDKESGYEIGFTGSLGIPGLDVYAFKNEVNKSPTDAKKGEFSNYGVKYNLGQTTFGYTKKYYTAASTSSAPNEQIENHYGIAYSIDKNLSVGIFKADASKEGTSENENVKYIQIGYNLGPVGLTGGYAKNKNIGGLSTISSDADTIFLRLVSAF